MSHCPFLARIRNFFSGADSTQAEAPVKTTDYDEVFKGKLERLKDEGR